MKKENNSREEKIKCLLHTALIYNGFFDENKDKRKRYSLALQERNGRIQYLLKLKAHSVSFVFGFRYQKQKQKIRAYGEFRIRQICLGSSFCLNMDRGVGELSGL